MRYAHWSTSLLAEQELVLAACQSYFKPMELGKLIESANSQFTIQLADELGVLGLVSAAVKQQSKDLVWTKAWLQNLGRNMMLADALGHWVNLFESRGLQPITFKGVTLGKLAFDHFSQRDSCDIDLIIPPQQFSDALKLLRAHGAVSLNSETAVPAEKLGAVTFEIPTSENTYTIDLHAGWIPKWGMLPERRIPPEKLTQIAVNDVRITTLGPELLCLHTIEHFYQHFFSLKTLMDASMGMRLVSRLGLKTNCRELAFAMGATIGEQFDDVQLILKQFAERSSCNAIPWRQGTKRQLATPSQNKLGGTLWSMHRKRDRSHTPWQIAHQLIWHHPDRSKQQRFGAFLRWWLRRPVVVLKKCLLALGQIMLPSLFLKPVWRFRNN